MVCLSIHSVYSHALNGIVNNYVRYLATDGAVAKLCVDQTVCELVY